MDNETLTVLDNILEKLVQISNSNHKWYDIWVAPVTAIASIFITAFLSYILGFRSQVKLSEKKARESSYGKLMGVKIFSFTVICFKV